MKEAINFTEKSLEDNTDMRREITHMFKYFSEFGDIVDLNLDYFPENVIITFAKHESVVRLLDKELIGYKNSQGKEWKLQPQKIAIV